MKIPKKNADLRRYVLKKDLRRVVLYILWTALFLSGALAYNANHTTYPPERLVLGWKLALWITATLISGFFIFRIYLFFTDRTYVGTIIRSGLSHTYEASRDPGLDNATDWDFRLNTKISVLKKGRSKPLKRHFEQKPGFYHYYYDGTEIIKFHGLPYPLAIENMQEEAPPTICLACGQMAAEGDTHCDKCHYSLVDRDEVLQILQKGSHNTD